MQIYLNMQTETTILNSSMSVSSLVSWSLPEAVESLSIRLFHRERSKTRLFLGPRSSCSNHCKQQHVTLQLFWAWCTINWNRRASQSVKDNKIHASKAKMYKLKAKVKLTAGKHWQSAWPSHVHHQYIPVKWNIQETNRVIFTKNQKWAHKKLSN